MRELISLLFGIKTELSLHQVLAVGVSIFLGYWVLYYASFSRKFRDELLEREGEDDEVNNGVFKQWVYEVSFIVLSGIVSIAIIFSSMSLKGFLNMFLEMSPLFYLIAGVACAVIISACVIIYLQSLGAEGRIYRKKGGFVGEDYAARVNGAERS